MEEEEVNICVREEVVTFFNLKAKQLTMQTDPIIFCWTVCAQILSVVLQILTQMIILTLVKGALS